ncbi:hypothetical protein IQ241_16280 [Romeria aff. gracilis LEGE 07310]|uniref:Uncharacterized protein n=1 Tax=Vasconcelosia minhoensis LEGE 07310 TaxID=915328 RepID=A0A8J7DCF2_9CYAN|nr:hypothetical protein [Romeria gracilis]MBE9078832.1 hypothetical protein [Romeria aff. gracilis LEGE 07310]
MDILQAQVRDLTDKVDSLYSLMQQLNDKVSGLEGLPPSVAQPIPADAGVQGLAVRRGLDRVLEHKDVLLDDAPTEDKTSPYPTLSPEIQIQRLTAQLTAAYNRIATLEEQLLTHRSY